MRAEIADLRADLHAEIGKIRKETAGLSDRVTRLEALVEVLIERTPSRDAVVALTFDKDGAQP